MDFAALVAAVEDYAILMLSPEGRVASWNSGAQRIKQYAADEILGRHFSVFYPPEEVIAGVCDRLLERARREGRVETEGWRVRKDGTRFWAMATLTAIHREDGELLGFGEVTRDLTTRKQADEERLRLVQAQEAVRAVRAQSSRWVLLPRRKSPRNRIARPLSQERARGLVLRFQARGLSRTNG